MALEVTDVKRTMLVRKGDEIQKILWETVAEQVKLLKRNGVEGDDLQAEIESIRTALAVAVAGMKFSGGVSSDDELPGTDYRSGLIYRVLVAGEYRGHTCEVGDVIMCQKDYDAESGASNDDWCVMQGNIEGAVVGPESAVDGELAVFDGASGKAVKSSGLTVEALKESMEQKDWIVQVDSMPDEIPENLREGGLLIVG